LFIVYCCHFCHTHKIEKKDEKDGLISIDESRDNQSEIQKITDKYIALIETKLSEKEKEILKV